MSEPLIYPYKEAVDGQRLQDMLAGPPLQRARAIVAAARTGLLDAQVMLGQILLQGDGIQRDPELAVIWFALPPRGATPWPTTCWGAASSTAGACPPMRRAPPRTTALPPTGDWT